ncbi:tetratricopeptide repeat protein [candidate division TA06 bacterium]|nr:tetratricopeptide repeat protein [candidate division TA06 bacterium]
MPDTFAKIKEKHIPWLIALVILILYAPALRHQYTYMDDYGLIVENFKFTGDIKNILQAFTQDAFGGKGTIYRPLLTVSFMLDAVWSGVRPWGYHLTNILLHMACCLLLCKLLKILLSRAGIAALFSLIFAVHPALNQAVAWIPGRNDSLLALFVLSSALAFIRYVENRNWQWLGAYLTLSLAALLTKESAVLLPLVFIPVYGYVLKQKGDSFIKLMPLLLGWLAILAFWYYLRNMAMPGNVQVSGMTFNGFYENVNGMLGYFGKIFFPFNLAAIPVPVDTNIALGIASVIMIIALFGWKGINNKPLFILGLAWYLMFLLPYIVSSSGYANFLEQRLYLPMAGLMLMLGQSKTLASLDLGKTVQKYLAAGLILLLAALSLAHNRKYQDGKTFWEYAVKTSPRLFYAHDMQGKVRFQNGEYASALESFREAARLKPDYQHAYNNMGMALYSLGNVAEAEMHFKKALSIDPGYAEAASNLGILYAGKARMDSALKYQIQAFYLAPDDENYAINAGRLCLQAGYADSAIAVYQEALGHQPGSFQLLKELGTLYFKGGRPAEAKTTLTKAYLASPKDPAIAGYLALLSFREKDYSAAVKYYDRAVELGQKADPRILEILKPYR